MKRRSFLFLLGSGAALGPHLPSGPILGSPVRSPQFTEPIEIGTEKQLFIDDYIIDSMEPRVFKLLSQPRKYQENPVIPLGTDWEQKGGLSHGGDAGKIFYDEDRDLFRFYGWMVEWPPRGGDYRRFLFYAESEDGTHWIKPRLGQVNYLGYDTNFIDLPFSETEAANVAVLKDPAAKSEREQYKMVYHDKKEGRWGMYPAYSSDGLHWNAYQVERPIVPFYSDTNNNLLWDSRHNRYMLYLRTFTRLDRWLDPESHYPEEAGVRTPAWASSEDFLHWDAPQDKGNPEERYVSFHADAQDPVDSRDFYTIEVLPYAGGYVGFTSVYHNYFGMIPAGIDSGLAQSPWVDRMDVQLLWSRDGKKFERIGQRRVFLPNGEEGNWDEHLVYTVQAPIVREDLGEIWIYYEGFSGHHWFNQRGEHQRGQVGLAILRLDGFISVTGIGSLTTRSLTFQGNQLTVNATGVDKYAGPGYGTVRVELLEAQTEQPISGFSAEDSDVLGEDSLHHTASWKGQAGVGHLAGRPIKLRFLLHKAKLFSFRFTEA